LVGDSLQTLAFQLLAEHRLSDDAQRQLEMIKLLAVATGSRGMAGGQAIDLASVGKSLTLPELEFMHIHKTGALIRAAVLLGAYCGSISPVQPDSAEKLDKLDRFGKLIGLAFQVVDDVLDCEADTATLGKTAGKDADNGKPTYVSLLGLHRARDMAQRLYREALESLAEFGDSAQRLRELADFIVLRKY
jgi:farnesyl diphosphate synthase